MAADKGQDTAEAGTKGAESLALSALFGTRTGCSPAVTPLSTISSNALTGYSGIGRGQQHLFHVN
jgi:hypothetical protein